LAWLLPLATHRFRAGAAGLGHADLALCVQRWSKSQPRPPLVVGEVHGAPGVSVAGSAEDSAGPAAADDGVHDNNEGACMFAVQHVDLSSNAFLQYCDQPWQLLGMRPSLDRLQELYSTSGPPPSRDVWTIFVATLLLRCPRLRSLDLSYTATSEAQAETLCAGLASALTLRHRMGNQPSLLKAGFGPLDSITIKGLECAFPNVTASFRESMRPLMQQPPPSPAGAASPPPAVKNLILNGKNRVI
jgi:hypothetical protein